MPISAANRVSPIRAAAYLMLLAVIAFAGVCTATQFWRTDLGWIDTPLSAYLYGPGGLYVRAVYYLMAAALLSLAWAGYVATAPVQRTLLASILFAAAGLALPIVAISELFRGTPYEALAHETHQVSAAATFLWLSFGMLLLSSRWRRDPRMKKGSLPGVVLAWLTTFVLWFQVLVPGLPQGLPEKLAIGLILLWLGWTGRHLLIACKP
jgi:hypothetical membrane protein